VGPVRAKEAAVSWDVWIIRPPEGVEEVSDLTSGTVLSSFTRRKVHAAAQAAFERVEALGWVGSTDTRSIEPVDVVDASFLRIDGPDVWADLGLDDSQDSLMLNVRSGSERLMTVILEFAARLDARVLDLQTGDWLTVDQGEASYAAWGAYRRRVISGSPPDTADGS
jgi:Zn-dependent M28 family amino/carboxypeptidase